MRVLKPNQPLTMERQQKTNKRKTLALLTGALCLSSTFFLFGVLTTYLSALAELWFGLSDVLWPTIIAFLAAAALLYVIGKLLWSKDG